MDCFERVIVGSGPAGVAAARSSPRQGTCIVDVGDVSQQSFQYPSLISALTAGDSEALLGPNGEMLASLTEAGRIHPKLRAYDLRFVMQGESFHVRDSIGKAIIHGAGSHAAGGMSNVWGAQLLRYTETDISEAGGWPLAISQLISYYEDLEKHIGISGQADDMQDFLGGALPCMPPVPMVPAASRLYANYLSHRTRKNILLLGRSRLAVASQACQSYSAHSLGETEFFTSGQAGLYTAKRTLEELRAEGKVTYLGQHQLLGWRESAEYVELDLRNLKSNESCVVRTQHLLLGCGTIQTARLVLQQGGEYGRALPFIDHPPTLLPLFMPSMFGSKLPSCSFPVQLIGTLNGIGRRDMVSLYYPGGLLWSDLLPDIPLPMNAAIRIMGSLIGGMLVAQIWETARPMAGNTLSLNKNNGIEIVYEKQAECTILPHLLPALSSLGAYSLGRFASHSPPGWGFHHAGCLPMRHAPNEYETHVDGRLWNSNRVRVIDGSVLPSLPAKNHSLTLMANAARIAEEVTQCGY